MSENVPSPKKDIKHGLYIISTPIGNLNDITLRAIEVLKKSNFILCEDTRVTKKLLNKYHVYAELISNHKFNEKKNLNKIIQLLKSGSVVSLVSDAGTPNISDPGAILIDECRENKIEIIPIPGPSAVTAAISVSGFSNEFYFYGFFPKKIKDLKEDMTNLFQLNCSIIFFISSNKFKKMISTIRDIFLGRQILICREMTKIYEEYIKIPVEKLDKIKIEMKGELTIVISPKIFQKSTSQKLDESDKRIIDLIINKLSMKEISNLVNIKHKVSKKEIYNYCLKLKNEK